jgi:hypothetical protein
MGEFIDKILGKCKHTSFFIVNEAVGGLTAECEKGRISHEFVPATEIVRMAKEQNLNVSLAGGKWELVGKKGFGERVSPEEAERLVKELAEYEKKIFAEEVL